MNGNTLDNLENLYGDDGLVDETELGKYSKGGKDSPFEKYRKPNAANVTSMSSFEDENEINLGKYSKGGKDSPFEKYRKPNAANVTSMYSFEDENEINLGKYSKGGKDSPFEKYRKPNAANATSLIDSKMITAASDPLYHVLLGEISAG
jgi:hypothetical protein